MKTANCVGMTCPIGLLMAVFLVVFLQPCAKGAAPFAHTQLATSITTSNATINGMAVPNGEPTVAWFEWGPRGSYAQTTSPTNIGAGGAVVRVSAPVTGLVSRGLYQCRLVSSNASGLVTGAMELFTTGDKLSLWGTPFPISLPPGLSNITQVSAGANLLALRPDGTIFEKDLFSGLVVTNITFGLSNIVEVAGAQAYYAALTADGSVYRWTTTTVPPKYPTPLAGASNIIAVAVGSSSGSAGVGLALNSEGNVTMWKDSPVMPGVPLALSNVVAVACGGDFALALKGDGTLIAWGKQFPVTRTNVPPGLTNIVKISAGENHSLALRKDGAVFAWGNNDVGQTNVPAGISDVIAISAGAANSAALKADGTIVVWGRGSTGQTNVPSGLTNVAAINASDGPAYLIFAICNRPPEASAFSYSGNPNHDLVVQLSVRDQNNDSISTRITGLPSAGSLYQYVAGNRGVPITAPDTVVSDPTQRVIFAPAANSIGSPYATFVIIADDGESVSAPATQTVNIVLPAAPQLSVATSGWNSNGLFNLNFTGAASATYRVWVSTNLVDWEVLGSAMATSNGWFNFLDAGAANAPQRFYRAGAP